MPNLFQSLLVAIASYTQKELARQFHNLKVENEILRGNLPDRITVTPAERQRLVRAAWKLGPMLKQLVTIVHPTTMLRWFREARRGYVPLRRGRNRKPVDLRRLVVKMARENAWGYVRILGELKKLGIVSISKNTVKRILNEAGMDPSPKRDVDAWDLFVKRHAESLWQCDFLHRKVVTWSGLRDAFVIAFIHVKTRRVILSPSTYHPDEAWVVRQSEEFVRTARMRGLRVGVLQHDSDGKFSLGFRQAMKRRQLIPHRNEVAAPVMNAFVEKFLQTLQQECLDHFLIFGTRHLDHLGREFLAHYHEERPHQGLGNAPIRRRPPVPEVDVVPLREVRFNLRLGGLLKSYSRMAA